MTQVGQFIARENIKRFETQLLESAEGTPTNTIRQLLKYEKLHMLETAADNNVRSSSDTGICVFDDRQGRVKSKAVAKG